MTGSIARGSQAVPTDALVYFADRGKGTVTVVTKRKPWTLRLRQRKPNVLDVRFTKRSLKIPFLSHALTLAPAAKPADFPFLAVDGINRVEIIVPRIRNGPFE